jgi:hypothetical protein
MDGSVFPGAQEGDSIPLKWFQGVRRARGGRPLADHDGPWPGPGVEHRRIRGLAAMVGGAQCTNCCSDSEWQYEPEGSPHLVVFRGNRANGEMNHVDGQGEPAPATMFGFATHGLVRSSRVEWKKLDGGWEERRELAGALRHRRRRPRAKRLMDRRPEGLPIRRARDALAGATGASSTSGFTRTNHDPERRERSASAGTAACRRYTISRPCGGRFPRTSPIISSKSREHPPGVTRL